MDAVNRTLLSTQNLLCALEQDASLLNDTCFMDKLAYLRKKHRRTTEYLSEITVDSEEKKKLKQTYHLNTGCTHYWNELYAHEPLPHDYHKQRDCGEIAKQTPTTLNSKQPVSVTRPLSTVVRPARTGSVSIKPHSATVASRKNLIDNATSPLKKSSSLWNLDGRRINETKPHGEVEEVPEKKPEPKAAEISPYPPKPTVPQPFKFASRKPIGNTYSQKFLQEMLQKKEEKQKEAEDREGKVEKFRAHPVPSTTYSSSNPLMHDKKYVDYLQRKIQGNLERNFQMRRAKSEVSLAAVRGRIPTSTYVPPKSRDYERSRSANRRAVDLLSKAYTPPGLKEHEFQTNIAFHLRHGACSKAEVKPALHRVSMPDFKRIHAELNEKVAASLTHKPTTIPRPFHLSESNRTKHRNCLSASPPRHHTRRFSPSILEVEKAIPLTHAWKLRTKATKNKLEKIEKNERAGEEFREEMAEINEMNRKRLKAMIKSTENIDWRQRVENKRRDLAEATREYKKGLEEMKQRVLSRPLIMERQASLVHKQALEKKFQDTMKNIGQTKIAKLEPIEREDSNESAGTFLVGSKRSSKEKDDGSFISESLNNNGEKLLSKEGSGFSVTSAKSSSSKASGSSSSTRSSHRSSNSGSGSSSTSASSGSRSSGRTSGSRS